MGLVEVVTFGGMLLTSTALWVAVITYFNGKHVKRSQDHLEALLLNMNERFEKQHAETVAYMRSADERGEKQHAETMAYLKQQGAMLKEWRREAAERSARQDAMLKEMQATLKEMQATTREVQAGQREIAKILERMDQRAQERHQEVMTRLG